VSFSRTGGVPSGSACLKTPGSTDRVSLTAPSGRGSVRNVFLSRDRRERSCQPYENTRPYSGNRVLGNPNVSEPRRGALWAGSGLRRVGLLACVALAAVSCSQHRTTPGPERLAILRFENLSSDPSIDWMGRAFSEIISRELASVPGIYALSFERLHRSDASFGSRPLLAPGISAERSLALAAEANRIGYGDYSVRAGRLEVRLTIEDPQTNKMTQGISVSAPAANPVEAATDLARQISTQAVPYLTRNAAVIQAYVAALESPEITKSAEQLEQAVARDPGFAPAYSRLAQVKLQQRDLAGAQAILDQGLAHGSAMPEIERTKLALDRARLGGDAAAAERCLADLARLAPNDPEQWAVIAQTAMNHHHYAQAMEAYEKAASIEPEDVNLLNQLGYAAAYAGDLNTSVQALTRYENLRPSETNPLDSLGDANLLLGRLKEAENFYLQAARKNPDFLNGADFFKAAIAHLMTGDISGADRLDKRFLDGRAAAKDPLVEFNAAEWAWISGRRKLAVERMAAFARVAEAGPLREIAAEAYAQLAIWDIALGNRSAAAPVAEKAGQLAGPGSAALAATVRFLAQPSASAAEWAVRADRAFPLPAQKPVKEVALTYALLADKEFQPAARLLEPLYDRTAPTADDSLLFLLAWADLETGKPQPAAALLRFNPLPPASRVKPFSVFYFPRLFYLRARLAMMAGDMARAREQFRIFRQLSGREPLLWGEEARTE